jgi:hypothetical protein
MALIRLNNQSLTSVTALPAGVGGKILNIYSVNKTDIQTVGTTTFEDVVNLTLTFTPTSSSSKFLTVGTLHLGVSVNADFAYAKVQRIITGGATTDLVGDADGARVLVTTSFDYSGTTGSALTPSNWHYIDEPNTSTELTYKVQLRTGSGNNAVYVNRTHTDRANTNYDQRAISNLTVYEVAG